MTNLKSLIPLSSHSIYVKVFSIIGLSLVMTCYADAVPIDIPAIKTLGDKVMPYVIWIFSLCCAGYSAVNSVNLVKGQPKAALYALGGAVGAGVGFTELFGEHVTTLLI